MLYAIDEVAQILGVARVDFVGDGESLEDFEAFEGSVELRSKYPNEIRGCQLLEVEKDGLGIYRRIRRRGNVGETFGLGLTSPSASISSASLDALRLRGLC